VAPPELWRTKVLVVTVEACTASLNVAVTGMLVATPVPPEAGVPLVTAGAACAPVVKDHVKGRAIGSPAVSLAPLTVAVYFVELAKAVLGVHVTVLADALYDIVVETVPELLFSVKLMVLDCTASLNVAVTAELVATPVALEVGLPLCTAGAGPVVNDQLNGLAIGSPAISLTPLTVAMYVVKLDSSDDGVRVAVLVEAL
jgi:hypothetical protein